MNNEQHKALVEAARLIKEFCGEQIERIQCGECCPFFHSDFGCAFDISIPQDWEV